MEHSRSPCFNLLLLPSSILACVSSSISKKPLHEDSSSHYGLNLCGHPEYVFWKWNPGVIKDRNLESFWWMLPNSPPEDTNLPIYTSTGSIWKDPLPQSQLTPGIILLLSFCQFNGFTIVCRCCFSLHFLKTTYEVNIFMHDNSQLPAQILDLFPHVYLFIFLLLVRNKIHNAIFVEETVSSCHFLYNLIFLLCMYSANVSACRYMYPYILYPFNYQSK